MYTLTKNKNQKQIHPVYFAPRKFTTTDGCDTIINWNGRRSDVFFFSQCNKKSLKTVA